MMSLQDYILRIGCAFITGLIIGIERQYHQRNAGLRTNMLVATGSAAFTVLSYAITIPGYGDPTRIAAQIVSGIGFLGGGIILKDGLNVRGLNTAATIWCSAACGTLSGCGMFLEDLIFALLILIINSILRPLCHVINKQQTGVFKYSFHVTCSLEQVDLVKKIILSTIEFDADIKINALFYKEKDDDEIEVCCEFESLGEHIALLDLIVSRLRSKLGIISAGWQHNNPSNDEA